MRQFVYRLGIILVLIVAFILGFLSGSFSADWLDDKVEALSTPVLEVQAMIGGTGYVNLSCKVLSDGGHNLTTCAIEVREIGDRWESPATGTFSSDKVYFQATKSGLNPRTVYEAHCYVTYLVDGRVQKAYTEIVQVMTRGAAALRDLTVVNTTTDDATFSINIVDDGNAPPVMKVEFIVFAYPGGEKIAQIYKVDTNGYPLGVHVMTMYDKLLPNTEYEVTCWVTNNFSPTSTSPVRFKTLPLPPVVSTSTLLMSLPGANNTYNATMRGTVSSDSGDPVTERGFVYGTSSTPTLDNSKKVTMGTGTGTYSATANGLNYNVKYYYRAYATNRGGTGYGEIRSMLKTPAVSPTPTPTPQPRPTATPTPTLQPRPTVTPTPLVKPSASPTPTKKPALTAAPSPTPAGATPAATTEMNGTVTSSPPVTPTDTTGIELTSSDPNATGAGTPTSASSVSVTTEPEMPTNDETTQNSKATPLATSITTTSATELTDPPDAPAAKTPISIWLAIGLAAVVLGGALMFIIRKR
jgi:hypothetical protein